jgi:hypothetical protein
MAVWKAGPLRRLARSRRDHIHPRFLLEGERSYTVLPPVLDENCECGWPAVVVILSVERGRKPLCWDAWSKF